jgi:hypothetical protein
VACALYFSLHSLLLYVAQSNSIYFFLTFPRPTLHPRLSNLPFVILPYLLLLHPLLDPNPVFCCSTLHSVASSLTANYLVRFPTDSLDFLAENPLYPIHNFPKPNNLHFFVAPNIVLYCLFIYHLQYIRCSSHHSKSHSLHY